MHKQNHPLRVLQVVDTERIAGIERHVIILSKELIANGIRCEIATSGENPLYHLANRSGVPISLSFKGVSIFDRCTHLLRYVRHNRPDILHAHTGVSKIASSLVGKHLGLPVVFTQHFIRTRADRNSLFRFPLNVIHRNVDKHLRKIIAVSDCVAESMRRRDKDALMNLQVIPLGIKDPITQYLNLNCSDRIHSTEQRIAYIGRLEVDRQPELFIDALGMLKEWTTCWEAYVIGDGKRLRLCRQLADSMTLSSKVQFTGWREDPIPLLSSMNILVNPCAVESFGLSSLEAMAMSKPVVAIDRNGSAEIIADGITGILTENNPMAFAGGLFRLVQEPDIARAMGREGRKLFLDRFTAEKMTMAIINAYNDIRRR